MSIFFLNNATRPNNNSHYGFFGQSPKIRPASSVPFGLFATGNVVIDTNYTDKILNSAQFAYNNNKPVSGRSTFKLANIANNILSRMSAFRLSTRYPGQELFGQPYNYQYIYTHNGKQDRIGVF